MYNLNDYLIARKNKDHLNLRIGLALIHRSFKSVSLDRGATRQRFAAHFPALGLLNLAQYLRSSFCPKDNRELNIKYFDEAEFYSDDEFHEAVSSWLLTFNTKILCFSTYTTTIDYVENFIRFFNPKEFLGIYGGAHVTLAPEVENSHFVIRGEGSAGLKYILENIFTDSFFDNINGKGICYRLNEDIIISKQAFDKSMETIPSPLFAYDLLSNLPKGIYSTNFTRLIGNFPQIYVCTQSCQARCSFCSTYLIHGKQVARPYNLIKKDLEYLIQVRGHDCIEFHDDDLLQHPQIDEILKILVELKISWFCYCRVDQITHDLANSMVMAGCKRVFLGIESFDQSKLDYFNKKTTVFQNVNAIDIFSNNGIEVIAGFIIGHPDDTIESIFDELDFLLKQNIYAINCSILNPDPGTLEFQRARKKNETFAEIFGGKDGKKLIPDSLQYGIETPFGLPTICNNIIKAELNFLVELIDAEFYFRTDICERLLRNKNQEGIALIRSYYLYVYQKLYNILNHSGEKKIIQRAVNKMESINSNSYWVINDIIKKYV